MIFKRLANAIFDSITYRISIVIEPIFEEIEYRLAKREAAAAAKRKEDLRSRQLRDMYSPTNTLAQKSARIERNTFEERNHSLNGS
jgi:hypothetical protein